MSIKKIILSTLLVIVVAGAATAFIAGQKYYLTRVKQASLQETAYIYISPRDNAGTVGNAIARVCPELCKGFNILASHNNFNSRSRSGKYAINNGDTAKDLYYRIVSNAQTPVKLVVPSRRDLHKFVGAVSKQLMMDSTELLPFVVHPAYYTRIGYTKETLPSLFIPDTYEVYWDIKPEDLMRRFLNERRKFWNDERKAKAKKIGMTPEQVATLASIVDEETSNNAEKPTVAGLYINRINKGIPLQADPTVKFALNDPTRRRILKKDLSIESPYNTYKHKGLPPGPIRIPSKQAIESVLNYQKHDYIFMCAKEDFSGTHNFAKTLKEHSANAKRYQQALNKLNIKK